jgi:hypothetical protein
LAVGGESPHLSPASDIHANIIDKNNVVSVDCLPREKSYDCHNPRLESLICER